MNSKQAVEPSERENAELLAWLEREPGLRGRLLAMKAALAAESVAGISLDEIETTLVKQTRGLGQELLTQWLEQRQEQISAEQCASGAHRHSKKNSGC
jgi:hypothetical protein